MQSYTSFLSFKVLCIILCIFLFYISEFYIWMFNQNVEACQKSACIYLIDFSLCYIAFFFFLHVFPYVIWSVQNGCVLCVCGCVCKANPSSVWLHSCSRQTTSSIHAKLRLQFQMTRRWTMCVQVSVCLCVWKRK